MTVTYKWPQIITLVALPFLALSISAEAALLVWLGEIVGAYLTLYAAARNR